MAEHDDISRMERNAVRAERLAPTHIERTARYFHSLTEIYEYYRGFGNTPPKLIMAEIARAEHALLEACQEEIGQGGALEEYYRKIGGAPE